MEVADEAATSIQSSVYLGRTYPCKFDGCGKTFKWQSYLDRHMLFHTGEKPFECSFDGCGYKAAQSGNLRVHELSHTGEIPEKKERKRRKFNPNPAKEYPCTACDKVFEWKSYLDRHMISHTGEKPYECTFEGCEYKTAQPGNLKYHTQMHTGVKAYECFWESCEYKSTHPGVLRKHMLEHTAKKGNKGGFACRVDECEFRANQADEMKKHMQNVHKGEDIFRCPWQDCDFTAAKATALKSHYLGHTGEKRYACSYEGCFYRSAFPGHVKAHFMTHSEEKPFHCRFEDCEFSGKTTRELEKHRRRHTGSRPHICLQCDFSAAGAVYVRKHMEKMHPEVEDEEAELKRIVKMQKRLTKKELRDSVKIAGHDSGTKLKISKKLLKAAKHSKQTTSSAVKNGHKRSKTGTSNGGSSKRMKRTIQVEELDYESHDEHIPYDDAAEPEVLMPESEDED